MALEPKTLVEPQVPAASPPLEPGRWLMLPVLLAAMFMAQFDLYVVNVAAPTLQHDIGAGQAALELIVAGYGFTYAAGLITFGRLGDLVGGRTMFLYGTLAFVLASLLCGLAQSPSQLVVARLAQGLTGAAMVPQVLALITRTFPAAERPKALAWFGVTIGLGAVAGQVVGGVLLESDMFGLGWRAIFLVNVPIGLVAALLAHRLLPRHVGGGRSKLDPLGAVGISGSLALILIPLVLGRTEGWPWWTWTCLIAALPALVATVAWERALARRGGRPMLDLDLLRNSVFARGLVVSVGIFCAFFSFMFTITLVMQSGLGLRPLPAGLAFTPLGIAFAVASIASPRVAAKQGARLISVGAVIAGAGLLGLLLVLVLSGADTSVARVIGPMILVGFGNGLAVPALTGAVLAGARPKNAGSAAGILTTGQQFAGAAGVAALGTVFFQALGHATDVAGYARADIWVVSIDLVLVALAFILSLSLPRPGRGPRSPHAGGSRVAGGVRSTQ